jgi:hypothetical protein
MTTPTESFNTMQAVLAECSAAGIAITQQNAAIRFARILQPISPSYIPNAIRTHNREHNTLFPLATSVFG